MFIYFNSDTSRFLSLVKERLEEFDLVADKNLKFTEVIDTADVVLTTPEQLIDVEERCLDMGIPIILLSDNQLLLKEYYSVVDVAPAPTSNADIEILYYRLKVAYRLTCST
jgi:hypothetical protein